MSRRQPIFQNRLLALMGHDDLALLTRHLEPVDLPLHACLVVPDQPISYVYFLEKGIASFIAKTPRGLRVEACMIGREGFTAPAMALDTDRIPHDGQMQVPGHGHRMTHMALSDAFGRSPSLRKLMLRFAQVMLVQNAVYPVEQRLARWLLMTHDRSAGDDLPVTHDAMSIMLGVHRPSVTNAIHLLEDRKLVRSERGRVTILDRTALERLAGHAYGRPEAEYRRLIGAFHDRRPDEAARAPVTAMALS